MKLAYARIRFRVRLARSYIHKVRVATFRAVSIGAHGERAAAKYLKKRGAIILARNWRATNGELDIIVVQNRVLKCVEVKTRRVSKITGYNALSARAVESGETAGILPINPFDSISKKKLLKLQRLFALYQRKHRRRLTPLRIRRTQVVGIIVRFPKVASWRFRAPHITYIEKLSATAPRIY